VPLRPVGGADKLLGAGRVGRWSARVKGKDLIKSGVSDMDEVRALPRSVVNRLANAIAAQASTRTGLFPWLCTAVPGRLTCEVPMISPADLAPGRVTRGIVIWLRRSRTDPTFARMRVWATGAGLAPAISLRCRRTVLGECVVRREWPCRGAIAFGHHRIKASAPVCGIQKRE